MPRVSVVIPCFNAEATLAETLDSMMAQSYRDIEMILLDDGSTDRTQSIAERCTAKDNRIRLIQSDHVGIVEALRHGCGQAQGDLIVRMDADDLAHPERVARQVALMDAMPEVGLCGTLIESFGEAWGTGRARYDTWINGLIHPEEIERDLFIECPIPHPTFCMSREVYESAGAYQEHGWPEDYDLVMRMAIAGAKFAKVPETLLRWRNHGARLSSNDSRYDELSFRALKRHYLCQTHLKNARPFVQWGAGEVGKRWLREWTEERRPKFVIDVNPKKFGKTIHGFEVHGPERLDTSREFIVIAVGAPGARDDIRAWLKPRGYREICDYLFIA